jgi:hypothetical protein
MTYIIKLTGRKVISSSRILTMVLIGLLLVMLHSSTVYAQWTTTGNDISNTNTGNVGVGTSTPTAKLHVSASGNVMAKLQSSTASAEFDLVSNASGAGSWGLGTGWASVGLRNLYLYDNVAAATRMLIDSSGNVGIGTASPTNLFTSDRVVHISSGTNPHLRITDTSNTVNTFMDSEDTSGNIGTTSNHNFNIFSNNLMRMTVTNGGYVGIGTNTPSYSLDVNGGVNGFRAKAATVSSSDAIATFENSSGIQAMVRGNGNFGIGTASPTTKLHVVGDVTVTGNIAAKYQDVAEWVESSQALPAGTVVVLDHTRSNQVIASSQAYDTRVAGVISAQPGITLGEKGESKVLVATTGRVKVKVDASAGPIQVGDLLVTSGKDGLAMKSQSIDLGGVQIHRPGTLIGKALEPLPSGTGEILVLLSLQ